MEFKLAPYLIAFLSAVILPFVSQWFKTPTMTRKVKFMITLGLSIGTGLVGYLVGGFSFKELEMVIPGILALSVSGYELLWKKVFEDSNSTVSRLFNFNKVAPVPCEVKPEVMTTVVKNTVKPVVKKVIVNKNKKK